MDWNIRSRSRLTHPALGFHMACAAALVALVLVMPRISHGAEAPQQSPHWELAACKAWDFHLRFLIEQHVRFGILGEGVDIVVVAELEKTASLCADGKVRDALMRYAALVNMLTGEPEELEDGEDNMTARR